MGDENLAIETAEMMLAGVYLDAVNPPNVIQGNGIGNLFAVGTGGIFSIPPTATRLVLGMPDECSPDGPPIQPSCYGDNSGQVSVTYKIWKAAGLTLSPAGGAPGAPITLAGIGFAPNETVEIRTGTIASPPSYVVVADGTGSFFLQAHAAQGPYGVDGYFAIGITSVSLGAASFSVTPAILTTPKIAAPGETIAVEAVGFGAGESVQIYWNSPRQLLNTATSNDVGSSKVSATVPADAVIGLNGLIGIGQTTNAVGIGSIRVE